MCRKMRLVVGSMATLSMVITIAGCSGAPDTRAKLEKNKSMQQRHIEELNGRKAAFVEAYLHQNYVFHGTMGDLSKDQVTQSHAAIMAAFPGLRLTIEDQIAEGDRVVMRWTGRGTHEGEFLGAAPTGKEVTITGITISRMEGDREIEAWEEVNMLDLMQQLGLVQLPGQSQ
jgi:predicted ester cyclase